MKQLLFLLLFPAYAMAQYPANANQKITLGEQTTADGLVFRGVASIDTVTATSKITRTNKQDTSVFLLLDTVTNLLWHYKIGSNAWTQAGGGVSVSSFSAGTTGLTPSTATTGAVTLGGTLAVANGGTGKSSLTANKILVGSGTDTIKSPINLHWDNTNSRLGVGTISPNKNLHIVGQTRIANSSFVYSPSPESDLLLLSGGSSGRYGISIGNHLEGGSTKAYFHYDRTNSYTVFGSASTPGGSNPVFLLNSYVDGDEYDFFRILADGQINMRYKNNDRFIIKNDGETLIGYTTAEDIGAYRLQVKDSVYVGGRVSAAGYTTRSDYNLKDEIQTLNYGLNEVIQMQPVKYTYKSNGEQQLGFIAQDIGTIIPESVHFDEFMGVDYQSIIPILTKAIQEQQTLIKALEQRILNLENK